MTGKGKCKRKNKCGDSSPSAQNDKQKKSQNDKQEESLWLRMTSKRKSQSYKQEKRMTSKNKK
jgi:hypothetical protein